ncbi:unnamed protein product [Pleuronectes platessa]|uniref:Uncharacterized protein n=1 Tax=Pleuronectes platessa TaxID=8262 RepID=A0A9N7YRV3_PLEPL|nr:unnamed protein product [Pleuronectes platessa]
MRGARGRTTRPGRNQGRPRVRGERTSEQLEQQQSGVRTVHDNYSQVVCWDEMEQTIVLSTFSSHSAGGPYIEWDVVMVKLLLLLLLLPCSLRNNDGGKFVGVKSGDQHVHQTKCISTYRGESFGGSRGLFVQGNQTEGAAENTVKILLEAPGLQRVRAAGVIVDK